ncbi:MAG: polymer-forming cytoskeletal protein [Candidatus Omnitrophica bacterium]|nr:polymer-forming cytoskeletal protein [Candidatus Omnitrophota bacterium]
MLKKKEEEKVLDVNASMQGSLVFSDPVNLRINGKFDGDLKTKGILQVGQYAEVRADIHGEVIIISGRVRGTILADKKICLLSTAVVQADISAPALEVKEGAIFEGRSSMIADTMELKDISRYLDIEENKILEWASTGKIPAIQDGSKWIFERKRIESWVKDTK